MLVRNSQLQAKFSKDFKDQIEALRALADQMHTAGVDEAKKFEAKVQEIEALAASMNANLDEISQRVAAVEARPASQPTSVDLGGIEQSLAAVSAKVDQVRSNRQFRFDIERGSDGRIIQVVAVEVDNAADGDLRSTIEAEIAEIEARMRADMSGYRADNAMQARYRTLLAQRDRAVA